jgi:hypothetical protein
MRWMLACMAVALVAGCLNGPNPEVAGAQAISNCRFDPAVEHVLYFGPRGGLQEMPAPAGFAKGNAFSSGFLTNDLKEWLSEPVSPGLWLVGNVTLDYWVRSTGTPAPLVIGGEPGEGYHFFNQFGSDRSLQPAFAVEYSDVAPAAGTVDHYTEQLELSSGGFVVEGGDRVRVLLTDLALDDGPMGSGHDVLFGGETPSQVRFTAKCWRDVRWGEVERSETPITLAGNQGLLTGAVPAGQANQQMVDFTIPDGVERLSITLVQTNDLNPVKDDVDITLLDAVGAEAWSIGSPYSDEAGALWLDNLQAAFPDGLFTVQVNSYSGVGYTGVLTVTFETARA